MKILHFDASVGRHVDVHGSDFRLSPIALLDKPIRTFALHLEVGGRVGRHVLDAPQLLCVTAGTGWVAGADGDPQRVAAGLAVLWDAREEHEAWTDFDELTAIVLEGEVSVWAPPTDAGVAPEPSPPKTAAPPQSVVDVEAAAGEVTTLERIVLSSDGRERRDPHD